MTDALKTLRDNLRDAERAVQDWLRECESRRRAEYEARGGCPRCRGRGWVVTWDTLDSLSGCYAEYGNCPNEDCTKESREASGLAPGYSKYDRNRGVPAPATYVTDEEKAENERRRAEVSRLNDELGREEARREVRRDRWVRVVKGRKVPVGTEGRVVWVGNGNWGLRVGVATSEERDANGRYKDVVWTAASNCEVVLDAA